MPSSASRVVLITGCSEGGIGFELATAFERSGRYHVFASARTIAKMVSLPSSIERVELDVTKQESVDAAVAHVVQKAGRIDVLINNAGVDLAALPLVEVPMDKVQQTYEANVFGTLRMTQAVAKHMIPQARKDPKSAGMIVNVGSILGYLSAPFQGAYNSTKAAVHSLSDALRNELAPFGIKVVVLAPGLIKTNIFATTAQHKEIRPDTQYKALEFGLDFVANSADDAALPVAVFARKALAFLEKQGALGGTTKLAGTAYYSIGGNAALLMFLARLPRWLSDLMLRRTYKIPTGIAALSKLEQKQKQKL